MRAKPLWLPTNESGPHCQPIYTRCLHLCLLPLPGVCVLQVPSVVRQEQPEGQMEEELLQKQNALYLHWPNCPHQGERHARTAGTYEEDRGGI